jgi:amidase
VKKFDREKAVRAIHVREHLYRLLKRFLGPNDLICMPTTPALAPLKGTLGVDRTMGNYYPRTLAMTAIAAIGRLPQVTLPLGNAGGVPIGLSLLAPQGMDGFLLAVALRVACKNGE